MKAMGMDFGLELFLLDKNVDLVHSDPAVSDIKRTLEEDFFGSGRTGPIAFFQGPVEVSFISRGSLRAKMGEVTTYDYAVFEVQQPPVGDDGSPGHEASVAPCSLYLPGLYGPEELLLAGDFHSSQIRYDRPSDQVKILLAVRADGSPQGQHFIALNGGANFTRATMRSECGNCDSDQFELLFDKVTGELPKDRIDQINYEHDYASPTSSGVYTITGTQYGRSVAMQTRPEGHFVVVKHTSRQCDVESAKGVVKDLPGVKLLIKDEALKSGYSVLPVKVDRGCGMALLEVVERGLRIKKA